MIRSLSRLVRRAAKHRDGEDNDSSPARQLRAPREESLRSVSEWEAEHGPLTQAQIKAARERLGLR